MTETQRIARVGPDQAGQRLDRFLAAALPDISRSRLKALIQAGAVAAGGAPATDPAGKVRAGDTLVVTVPAAAPAKPAAQAIPLDVLFEDADLIVIAKPAGIAVHPAPGNPDRTLVNALIAHCGASLSGIGGVARPGIVHRLDKDTSGVLVAAKTDRAHAGLAAQFAARKAERSYRALVWGVPSPRAGRIEGAIGRSPRNRKKMAVVARGGKAAATRYRVLAAFGTLASLVECRLETGRTHQIRVHMAHIGHPVIGDPAYGRAPSYGRTPDHGRTRRADLPAALAAALDGFARQALHAETLAFAHPATGERLAFSAPPPEDFLNLLRKLEQIEKSPQSAGGLDP